MSIFFLLPRRISIETSLTPAQCRAKLIRELIEYRRKPSLIAASQFLKKHRLESCYFGSCEKNGRVEIFYHRAKKHDGSSAGFFGKIDKLPHGKGAVISGTVRRTAAVITAAAVWLLLLILLILCLIAVKEYSGAAAAAVLLLAGEGLILYDRSAEYVKKYLESFPERND